MLFGGANDGLADAIRNGGIIIDVRTPGEFAGGHVAGSKNIPLNELPNMLGTFKKEETIVFCCASGARSGSATNLASAKGLSVINGGPWTSVNRAIAEIQESK